MLVLNVSEKYIFMFWTVLRRLNSVVLTVFTKIKLSRKNFSSAT